VETVDRQGLVVTVDCGDERKRIHSLSAAESIRKDENLRWNDEQQISVVSVHDSLSFEALEIYNNVRKTQVFNRLYVQIWPQLARLKQRRLIKETSH
jgi:hypothetical protein